MLTVSPLFGIIFNILLAHMYVRILYSVESRARVCTFHVLSQLKANKKSASLNNSATRVIILPSPRQEDERMSSKVLGKKIIHWEMRSMWKTIQLTWN